MPFRFPYVLAGIGSVLILAGCGGMNPVPQKEADRVWSSHEDRPEWTRRAEPVVQEGEAWFFVGQSMRHATERGAIDAARRDAVANAVKAVRRNVEVVDKERIEGGGSNRSVQTKDITVDQERQITAVGSIGPIRTMDSYVAAYDSEEEGRFYRSFVKVRVPPKARQSYRDSFGEAFEEDANSGAGQASAKRSDD